MTDTEDRIQELEAELARLKAKRREAALADAGPLSELAQLLEQEEDVPLTILPNGQIVGPDSELVPEGKKPLTFREDLGGELYRQTVCTEPQNQRKLEAFG